MSFLSTLFRPQKLIDAIKAKKVHIKGIFVLFLTLILTFLTMLPVFAILIAKIYWVLDKPIVLAIKKAFLLSAILLALVPFSKWWLQSLVIHACLRTKREELQKPTFSVVLLGRSFGLLPMILLIPLKVLLIAPMFLLHHIFFPPISALILTGLDAWMQWPAGLPWDVFILSRPTPGIRPSFWISVFFVLITYILTVRKIRSLSELPKKFLFARVLFAIILWDVVSMAILLGVPVII